MLVFARNFFMHPMMLGSVIPSSSYLIEKVLRNVDWTRARCVVEYGPGVGTLTRAMLERMGPEGRLIALETNGEFVRFLRDALPDPRLNLVPASAAEVASVLERMGGARADYVVSGIPFSTMPAQQQMGILRASRDILEPGGALLVYQFSRRLLPALRSLFPRVECVWEPRNFLPAWVFCCRTAP